MKKYLIVTLTIVVAFINVKIAACGIHIKLLDNYEISGNTEDVVHVGDPGFFSDFIQPYAIGTSYTLFFDLKVEPIAGKQFIVHLEHYNSDTDQGYQSCVYLNGIHLENLTAAEPYVHWLSQYIKGDNNILMMNDNELTIISGQISWNHDDFEFTNVYVEYIPVPTIPIEIDIKPGSYPNSINFNSEGKVPVAILTTDDFDAKDVAPDSVNFAGANPLCWRMEDVDNDSDYDMLFYFKTRELDLTKESTEATLEGETIDGVQITGTDSVNIVPKGKGH